MFAQCVLTLLTLLATAWLAAAANVTKPQPGLTPDKDPFFKPPQGWEKKQPGDILRWRQIQPVAYKMKPKLETAYQLLYRTTRNNASQPLWTVTTVFVPHNARRDSFVMVSDPTDSDGPMCQPSYQYMGGGNPNDKGPGPETLFLPYMSLGYIVSLPDVEGPKDAFGAARLEGHALLDAARATLKFSELKLSKNAKIGGYGYSGGALTMGWAAALQPTYASELNVAGWTFGGTPANLTTILLSASGGIFAGYTVSGMTGVFNAYPEIHDVVEQQITEEAREAMKFARGNCSASVVQKYRFTNFLSKKYFKDPHGFLYNPKVQKVLQGLTLGVRKSETPRAPVFMYHGQFDEVVKYQTARKAAEQWCHNGGNIQFLTYTSPVMEHLITQSTAKPRTVFFLHDRLQGKPFHKGCRFDRDGSVLFDPKAFAADLRNDFEAILRDSEDHIGLHDSKVKDRILNGRSGKEYNKSAKPHSRRQ